MGFLGPVSASELGAVYNPVDQVLTLSAAGEVQNFTYGFTFNRVAWTGGLRFELWAWSGPIGEGKSSFSYSQKFTISNLPLIDPSNTVIIVTANNPTGKVVTINWTGLKPPTVPSGTTEVLSTLQGKLSGGDEKPAPPQTIDLASPPTINTLFREPFNISERINPTPGSGLHVDFDSQILTLTEAGVDDGALYWTFNSLQTGQTQVITTTNSGPSDLVTRKVYNVKIFVLDAATSPSSAAPKSTTLVAASNGNGTNGNGTNGHSDVVVAANGNGNGNGSPAKPPHQILSFLGRVFEAQRIAQHVLPSARLLRVQANKPVGGPVYPVTDPLLLSQLDVLFVGDGGKYVTVKSIGWGEWAWPEVKEGVPVLGLKVFDLTTIKVDIVQAAKSIRAGGNDMAFWEATLAEPLGNPQDGPIQPLYSFRMVDTSIVAVNAVTGKVVGK